VCTAVHVCALYWIKYGIKKRLELFQASPMFVGKTSGLYYKPMTIVNDNSRVVNKPKTSLTDDARVIIYDHHMFIVQATGAYPRVEHFAKYL
jgi:hypothetical protein